MRLTLHGALQLQMESFLLPLPFVSKLLPTRPSGFSCALPTALVALKFYSQFVGHCFGHTEILHVFGRLSLTTKAFALWLLPGFLRLTALCNSSYLWYNLSHSSPSMPLKRAWQMACRSSSTSGGAPSTVFHACGVGEGALSTFFSSSQTLVGPLLHEPLLVEGPRYIWAPPPNAIPGSSLGRQIFTAS